MRRIRFGGQFALLALATAACDGATTGWIPFNGGLSGVITVASSVNPPAFALPTRSVTGTLLTFASPQFQDLSGFRLPPVRSLPLPAARPEFAAHDLIVIFKPQAFSAPVGGSLAAAAVIRSRLSSTLPAGVTIAGVSPAILAARVQVQDTTQREALAELLRSDPAVASVNRDRLFWLDDTRYVPAGVQAPQAALGPTVPNNPLYPLQAWHYGLVDLPRAWSLGIGSRRVLVAVVDDGIRFDHPGIAPNLTSDGYDFVSLGDTLTLCAGGTLDNTGDGDGPDSDPTIPASYSLGPNSCFTPGTLGAHGLHVAGTIGAVGNTGIGVTGVNWAVNIRPVRVLGVGGFGRTYDIAQGILYAAGLPADNGAGGTVQAPSGANIINMSLGGSGDDPVLHQAIISAAGTGALIVVAAGNSGNATPVYPAAYPEVLAVAAVSPDGNPVSYSSYGPWVAIRAPGGNFNQGGASGGVASTLWNFGTKAPDYGFSTGTSMATPHVSGAAALLLASNPTLSAANLRTRLTQWAVGPSNQYGAGLLNVYNSLAQRFGPPRKLFVRAFSATTGDTGGTAEAATDGSFSLTHVKDGAYFIYGGADEDGDQKLGLPGRWWGAFGDPAVPTSVSLLDQVPPRSFSIGFPIVASPYHFVETPNVIVVGGYVQATYGNTSQLDVYRVRTPAPGQYTFETTGWVGACGFALEEATGIGVYDSSGKFITNAGYIDRTQYNYCTRLTVSLGTGTYLVGVAGAFAGGRYRLAARSAN